LKNKFTKELIKKIINPNDPDIKDEVWTGLMFFMNCFPLMLLLVPLNQLYMEVFYHYFQPLFEEVIIFFLKYLNKKFILYLN
jgi:hypothetical protein